MGQKFEVLIMRARIWQSGKRVFLRWPDDGRVSEYFTGGNSPHSAVLLDDGTGRYPQVCDKLYTLGSTLTASRDTLLAVIRREYRARQADLRRRGMR